MTGDFNITVNGTSFNQTCHGCAGKGWVETSDKTPHKCPVCVGSGNYTPQLFPSPPIFPQYPVYPMYPSHPIYPDYKIISGSNKFGDVSGLKPEYFSGSNLDISNLFNTGK